MELDDGVVGINFLRCVTLSRTIKDVIGKYKPPDLKRAHNAAELAYLESQLRKIGNDADLDIFCRESSRTIAEQEKRQHVGRTTELRAMGFAVRH
jgi:hypothetical protein